jgi:predicted RND superfamily exporter protein
MIKKIFIFLILTILLTGCFKNEDFTKVCTEETTTNNYKESIKYTINYNNKDEVTKVIIQKKYNITDSDILNSVKNTIEKYNKTLEVKGIETNTFLEKNKYEATYTVDVPNVSKEYLDSLYIKQNSIKYFNYLRKNKIECANA